MKRLAPALCCLVAMIGGCLVGVVGCGLTPCGGGAAPDLEVRNGLYEIVGNESRAELDGATVEIQQTRLTVSYALEDGSNWNVEYEIVDRSQ